MNEMLVRFPTSLLFVVAGCNAELPASMPPAFAQIPSAAGHCSRVSDLDGFDADPDGRSDGCVPSSMYIESGDGQIASAGATLAPFTVAVVDRNHLPVSGVTVQFALSQGTGQLSSSSSVTDDSGHAAVTLVQSDRRFQHDVVVAWIDGVASARVEFVATTVVLLDHQELETGKYPYALVIGDLDNDGKSDVVDANTNSNTVSIMFNTTPDHATSASFAIDRVVLADSPGSVAVGDIDGDGRADLLVRHGPRSGPSNTTTVYVNTTLPGDTTASFATGVDIATFNGNCDPDFCWATFADVNGDGKLDVVTARTFADDFISLMLNTGSGPAMPASFGPRIDIPTGTLFAIDVADFDSDGKSDVVSANWNPVDGTRSLSLLRNTTAVGSSTPSFERISLSGISGFTSGQGFMKVGDLNGDALPDIAITDRFARLAAFANTTPSGGPPSLGPQVNLDAIGAFASDRPLQPQGIALGDADGDGLLDVLVSEVAGGVTAFFNIGAAGDPLLRFAQWLDYPITAPRFSVNSGYVGVADLNADGRLDAVVTWDSSGSDKGGLSVLLAR